MDGNPLYLNKGGNENIRFYTEGQGAIADTAGASIVEFNAATGGGADSYGTIVFQEENGSVGSGDNATLHFTVGDTSQPDWSNGNTPAHEFAIQNNGDVDIYEGDLDMNGGNVVNTSDRRLKSNIESIENGSDKVMKLEASTFLRDDSDDRQAGIIAQSVEDVLPEAVVEDENGYLKLADSQLIALLVSAVQEQQTQIENMQAN
jgi:hypothetical protein